MSQGKTFSLVGVRFSRLVVHCLHENHGKVGRYWECICDCGNTTVTSTSALMRGSTSSCGCLGAEHRISAVTTHAMSYTRPYRIWTKMNDRCYNPDHHAFARYGGRGITVCTKWIDSFESFWLDMQSGYGEKLSIDRIDNDGNYEPGNCRWATTKQQARNRGSRNRIIATPSGDMLLCEALEKYGIDRGTLTRRIHAGWSLERQFSGPDPAKKLYPCQILISARNK